ncbi:NADH:flavorubredoxin reductase NorW [Vibrio clamense]|uniref:NADH:flavorubredoxin reductase NorW n=1 Tax=Vibrio clamense TaxID=2910254 RepID=UPI003D1A5EB6
MTAPITIIGSGFAAYQLVKSIRRQDNSASIRVITADDGHDYNKPDLSHVFSKQQQVSDVITLKSEAFAQQYHVELLTNHQVTSVDAEAQTVTSNEKTYSYSSLVFATGATPFVPPFAGSADNRIMTLNSLKEFERYQTGISTSKHMLLIGGGLIGVELALDLANSGKKVTLVEPNTTLMQNLLPEYVADKLTQALKRNQIVVHTEVTVTELNEREEIITAQLNDGSKVEADSVMVCAGLTPNVALAEKSGLAVNRGICVNTQLQTSQPNIYALGDCAELDGQVRAYLQPTLMSATALAKTLLGSPSAVNLPSMMIKVKTPSYPIQVAGITDSKQVTRWNMDIDATGIIAKAFDEKETLIGFVVTEQKVTQAFTLLRAL